MIQIMPRKSCMCGKRCLADEASAQSALRECRARGRPEQRYYRCHMCGSWHLTSKAYMPKAA